MTYAEIEAFLAVVQTGTMTGAAERLFLSQSTLSGRVSSLEQELEMRLFQRGKGLRSAELTEQGQRFLPVAERWQKLWRETEALRGTCQPRELRVSSVESLNLFILPQAYRIFSDSFPETRLWLLLRQSVDSYAVVENGLAEAAVVVRQRYSRKVETVPLWEESMEFLCEETGNYGPQVCAEELDPRREILLDWGDDFLRWHDYWFGPNPSPRLYTDDMGLLEQFLHDPGAWAVMPRSVAERIRHSGRLRPCRLVDGPGSRVVYLLTHSMTPHSAELTAFLQILRRVVTAQGARWLAD